MVLFDSKSFSLSTRYNRSVSRSFYKTFPLVLEAE